MHLDDRTIDELVAGELEGEPAALARRHLAECESCRMRAAELEAARREISRGLAAIDHPMPPGEFANVVARAREGQRRAPLLVAGAGVLVAAALAAALPSSPLHRVLTRGFARPSTTAAVAPSVQRAVAPADGNAVAIEVRPGITTRVTFRARQTTGAIHVAQDTGRVLRIAEVGGAPVGYAVAPSSVTIDNAGSVASYEMRVPSGSRVLMRIAADTVLVTGHDQLIDLARP